MPDWKSIPTLVGLGADAVQTFADEVGLTESDLRQADWETLPYLEPGDVTGANASFDWKTHTYAVYRVRTISRNLWLFWFAIADWQPGQFIPISAKVVAYWRHPDPLLVTPCASMHCANPAYMWPGPAFSMKVQVDKQTYSVNYYGCGDAHRQELQRVKTVTLLLQTPGVQRDASITVARATCSLVPREEAASSEGESAGTHPSSPVRTRAGRLEGCSYDQWVFDTPTHWLDADSEVLETMIRTRLQEYFDHFHEYNGFWRFSINYPRTLFTASGAGGTFHARTAQGLADTITEDYQALRVSWQQIRSEQKEENS